MKHDKLTGIIALAILALTLAACGEVETGGPFIINKELGDSYFELYNNDTEYRVGNGNYRPCPWIVDIPAVYNGKPVTEIARWALSVKKNLIEVTIPASVIRIGEYAFSGSTSLTSVTFHGSISSANFSSSTNAPFLELRDSYLAGGIGTYTRTEGGTTWTKQ